MTMLHSFFQQIPRRTSVTWLISTHPHPPTDRGELFGALFGARPEDGPGGVPLDLVGILWN